MHAHVRAISETGWAPAIGIQKQPFYVRNPIVHEIKQFTISPEGRIKQSSTDLINIGGLNYADRNFNRQKGVVEYADLTHLYHARQNQQFEMKMRENMNAFHSRSSEISQFAEDAVLNKEPNPFRVGR